MQLPSCNFNCSWLTPSFFFLHVLIISACTRYVFNTKKTPLSLVKSSVPILDTTPYSLNTHNPGGWMGSNTWVCCVHRCCLAILMHCGYKEKGFVRTLNIIIFQILKPTTMLLLEKKQELYGFWMICWKLVFMQLYRTHCATYILYLNKTTLDNL